MNGPDDNSELEQLRQTYLPERVRLLFVGESPPASGTFFYRGNSLLARYTREAFERVYGESGSMEQFLKAFRAQGFYLVDLCARPVDGLEKRERRRARRSGVEKLADVLRKIGPLGIVAVMKAIEPQVLDAVAVADLRVRTVRSLPFPAQGHQREYVTALVDVLRALEADSNV